LQERQGYAKSVAMPTEGQAPPPAAATERDATTPRRPFAPAAERALAEAAARRAEQAREGAGQANEVAGRGGLDPARYGDWEINGIAADF
jgi:hypothetical protein